MLRVEDTGPGIPAAQRELVFERFYRIAGSEAEGSGLGLAIVKEIVDAHQGTIALRDGTGGRGLIIEVRLPAGAEEALLDPDVAEGGGTPLEQPVLGPG